MRYYVTFRHRRDIDASERAHLLRALLQPEGRKWDLMILCILPGQTELIFSVKEQPTGAPYELSTVIERAKQKAGKAIVKKSGETFPPFYSESYDRIIRDEVELQERWQAIYDSPVHYELAEEPEGWEDLWVAPPADSDRR